MEFEKVQREHILQGIKDFEEKGYPNGFGPSSTYDLIYEGKTYPPKAIMAYANYHASGRKLERYFKGGLGTDCFICYERNNFEIIEKVSMIKIIQDFLSQAKTDNLKTKHFLNSYKGLKLKVSFGAGITARIPWVALLKPPNKVQDGIYPALLYYKEVGKLVLAYGVSETNTSQFTWNNDDAKSIHSWYTREFNKAPERYGKSKIKSVYDVNSIDYKEVQLDIEEIIKEYKLLTFNVVREPNSEYDLPKSTNYWIFQGNPDIYDFKNALKAAHLKSWKVAAHKDKIKIGDKVIIWQTGDQAGCFALAEVTSDVTNVPEEELEKRYYKEDQEEEESLRVKLRITSYLAETPLLWKNLKALPEFKDFKAGNQGTNFTATEAEYNYLDQFATNQKDFLDVAAKYSNDELLTYFSFLDKIIEAHDISIDDPRTSFSCASGNINLNIGQRPVWRLTRSKGFRYVIISDKKLSEDALDFEGSYTHYFNQLHTIELTDELTENVLSIIKKELDRTTRSGYRSAHNISFELAAFNKEYRKQLFPFLHSLSSNTIKKMRPNTINQILYGPPGTGKTYNTINESLKIIDIDFYEKNKDTRKRLTDKYREMLITDWNETKGQIAFCTFHQSFSYEDFVEGIKPQTTQEKNVYYDVLPGIFKKICELADSSQSASKLKKQGKISWTKEQFKKAILYKLSLGEANNPDDREIYEFCIKNNYIAIGFGNNFDYSGLSETKIKEKCEAMVINSSAGSQLSTFIHGLSKGDYVLISKGNQFVRALGKIVGNYEYHDDFPIRYNHFREVEWVFTNENIPIEDMYDTSLTQRSIYKINHDKLKQGFFVPGASLIEKEENDIKPYVLIVDEINRGNVSSIFGELITLIEPDKRAGEDEALEIVLPYSKEKFSVPSNVYIIGTMNTADRSVEALDTALRRRFTFKELMPDSSLLFEKKFNGFTLQEVLQTINERIEVLVDRDHTIGHSYFLTVNSGDTEALTLVFQDKIIPLLQEYFYHDYQKIALILGSGFIEEKTTNIKFAHFKNIEQPSIENQFILKTEIDDIENAMQLLLNKNED